MDWEEIKNRIKQKCLAKEIDSDTIEFSFFGKRFRLHRFEIPDGFLVDEEIKRRYNGKLVLFEKVDDEWRLFHGY